MFPQHQVGDSEFRSFHHGSRPVGFPGLRRGELPVSIKWALRSDSLGPGLNPAGSPSAPGRNSSRSGRGKKMSEGPPKENVSRRAALKIIAGSAGAAINLPILQGSTAARPAHLCRVAAPAAQAAASAPKFFTAQEIQTLAALSETIIPADEHSPGARAARVFEYIDEIISDANEATKSLWRKGLAAIDRMAEAQNGKKFADCTPGQ